MAQGVTLAKPARIRHSRESGNPSPPVGAPLVGARSPSLRPLPLWRPLCSPPADWNTAGVERSCPPLPLGEGWGEGGGWSGARRRPWSRKPRLRKGPLWGRLREGARRQACERPEGASPSARIRHSRESGRPLCNPPADWNTAGAGRSCPPLPLGEGWGEGGGVERGAPTNPSPPVGAPLVGARSPSLRPLPLWRPLCSPPADWNTAGVGRSCPPLPLGEGWGEGGGWSGARRRPWSRKPRLRKGPLWGD